MTEKEIPNEEIPNEEIRGDFAPSLSMRPLKEVKELTYNLVNYLEKLRDKHRSSVFKIHPGIKTIVCLDHISATFYFNAPRTVLEREDKPRFGPLAVRPELLRGSCPALVASGEKHDHVRQLTNDILKTRAANLEPAFDEITERLLKKWPSSSEHNLWEMLIEWSGNTSCNWLFEADIDMRKIKGWINNILTIDTDSALTQVLGKIALPKCPQKSIQTQKEMREFIEKSSLFQSYIELAKKNNVPLETLSDSLIFFVFFNGSGAPTFGLYYAITRVYSDATLKESLKKELTGASKNEILKNPLLDNLFHEVLRLNAVPRVYFKKAQCDFSMPAAGGKFYAIKKGDLVLIPTTISHKDATVFENPEEFDPYRFEKDPTLKEKVFGFGITNDAKNPYGCAAGPKGSNQAPWLWKNMFAQFITNIDFEFVEEPTFDSNKIFNFHPGSIKMKNVKFQHHNIDVEQKSQNDNLKKEFSEMANRVRNKEVEFNKKQYLKLYGLYKQALDGDNSTNPPSRLKVLATEKWISWNRLKGTTSHEAMREYIEISSNKKSEKIDTSKKTVENVKSTLKDEIEISCNTTDAIQTIDANFSITADTPDIDSSLQIEILLCGDEGDSGPIKILLPKVDDLKKIECAVDIPLIGKPQVIYLSINPFENNDDIGNWLLEKVAVSIGGVGVLYEFPHNLSIAIPSNNNILFEATGCLPGKESDVQQKARKQYLEQKRRLYKWKVKENLPSEVDFKDYGELPIDEQFKDKAYSMKTADSQQQEERPDSFEYYKDRAKLNDRPLPRLSNDELWMKDEEFGRLYLQGTHCNFLEKCNTLPKVFNLDNAFHFPTINLTLGELIDQELLYICDYEMLENASPPEGRYLAAPIVLFYSDKNNHHLMPIAIQIDRDKKSIVFTSDDAPNDWLLAKMWARVADISVHQLYSHFLLTHGVTEAFVIAAHRIFSPVHPVFQLLLPHFKHTLCINTIARTALLNKGGWIDRFGSFGGQVQEKVLQKGYKEASLKSYMNFPRDLEKRGVNDIENLPHYPYRDDGLLIWEAVNKYVHNIINIYYKSDCDVQEDHLLKEWLTEFESKGHLHSDWGNVETLEDLIDLVTSLIFNATAIHGAMNILQYEVYGFVPNSPSAMHSPTPKEKNITTKEDILTALPGNQTTLIFLFLSELFNEDVKLGVNEFIYSSNPDFRYELLKFKIDLKRIEKIIVGRNNEREVPYIAMLPSNIPNSIDL